MPHPLLDALGLSSLLVLASCERPSDVAPSDPSSGETTPAGGSRVESSEEPPVLTAREDARPRRGVGAMTARAPGREAVIDGVRLASHHVKAVIQDGFARTTIEEAFFNETRQVLEGRYVFPLPRSASLSRLALWVGGSLVEGEIVERDRARRIFHGIVEDTVRPRDPALLEWVRGSEFSMTIFPIPARGSRTVVLAYDELVHAEDGALRYVVPLSLGAERATPIGELTLSVEVVTGHDAPAPDITTSGWSMRRSVEDDRVRFDLTATNVVPERDLVVRIGDPAAREPSISRDAREARAPEEAKLTTFQEGVDRTFATRVVIPPDLVDASVDRRARDTVIVLDVSGSQSSETLHAEERVATSIVRSMTAGARFAVLACDSACEALPKEGLVAKDAGSETALAAWLVGLASRGSSDLSGALQEGIRRADDAQPVRLVMMHDGTATAGDLSTRTIVASVAPALADKRVDLRLLGVGRSVDEASLGGLARALGGAYEAFAGDGSLDDRARDLVQRLDRPLLVSPHIDLPSGLADVRPSTLPALALGDTITLVGKVASSATSGRAHVTGTVDGEPAAIDVPIGVAPDTSSNPLLPRLWAERAIEEIDAAGGPDARARIVALSREAHVMSRYTSFLVLESDRMFSDFGIARTTRRARDQSDEGFGERPASLGSSELGSGSPLSDRASATGSPAGRLRGRYMSAPPPQVRMGSCEVSGRLPPESVRRIIRLQTGRFRACYEHALMKDPSLAGRVVARFVIDRAGQVGDVEDAGSDLPDPEVVACVLRGFYSLDFPQPEGGVVTVTYPFAFSSDGTRPTKPVFAWPDLVHEPREPSSREMRDRTSWRGKRGHWTGGLEVSMHVDHDGSDETWRVGRDEELGGLERAVIEAPSSRARRDRWVRGLVQAGRFEQARDEAQRFVELDPDLGLARELSAEAAAVVGDARDALFDVEAFAEAEPSNANAHLRAARALAAMGDETRACAHLRSIAEIEGTKEARDRAEACGPRGSIDAAPRAVFEARVECDDATARCPEVAVLTPGGRVVSRAAPFGAIPRATGLALLAAGSGTYRTLLFGGDASARGRLVLDVHGKRGVFPFEGGGLHAQATTHVTEERTWLQRRWVYE